MEHIVGLLSGRLPDEERFCVEMTGVTYPDKAYHIVREKSDLYCLEYVIAGRGCVQCAGQRFFPQAGDVYLLPPGVRHDYRALPEEPFEKIWMNIRGSLCDSLYGEYRLAGRYHFQACPIYPLFRSFLSLCEEDRGDGRRIAQRGALLVHAIFSALAEHGAAGAAPERTYARQARDYIDLHVTENLRLRTVAAAIGISPSQMNRSFVRAYGVTPYRYFLSRRIDLACALLRNTGLQVREIADQLHFADEHYFSSLFREKTGDSPRAYRMSTGGAVRPGRNGDAKGTD